MGGKVLLPVLKAGGGTQLFMLYFTSKNAESDIM